MSNFHYFKQQLDSRCILKLHECCMTEKLKQDGLPCLHNKQYNTQQRFKIPQLKRLSDRADFIYDKQATIFKQV